MLILRPNQDRSIFGERQLASIDAKLRGADDADLHLVLELVDRVLPAKKGR